jgi:hypothetical protein
MPAYLQTFVPSDVAPKDLDGVVMVNYRAPIGLQYNPVTVAQAALGYFDRWHSGNDSPAEADSDRMSFFAQVNWLVSHQTPDGRWLYAFAFAAEPVPWWSAMAEGLGISVMLRAYSVTRDGAYLTVLERAKSTFDRSIADLGVTSTLVVSGRQLIVYQEYLPGYEDNVLNGWVFALAGLYECATYLGDSTCSYDLTAADRGLAAVRALLPYYDTGSWSLYSLDSLGSSTRGARASVSYHRLHIRQLRWLYSITGDPVMREYADRFQFYLDSAASGTPSSPPVGVGPG